MLQDVSYRGAGGHRPSSLLDVLLHQPLFLVKINGFVIVGNIVQRGGRGTLAAHPRVTLPPRPTRLGQGEVGEIHGSGEGDGAGGGGETLQR